MTISIIDNNIITLYFQNINFNKIITIIINTHTMFFTKQVFKSWIPNDIKWNGAN